jgi:hypothetical protein
MELARGAKKEQSSHTQRVQERKLREKTVVKYTAKWMRCSCMTLKIARNMGLK